VLGKSAKKGNIAPPKDGGGEGVEIGRWRGDMAPKKKLEKKKRVLFPKKRTSWMRGEGHSLLGSTFKKEKHDSFK